MRLFSVRNLLCLLVVCLGLGIGNPLSLAFANSNETLQSMATVLSVFVKFFTFIALMIMSWGGELMGTEFLTSDAAMEGIRPMWIYIRNITNIGFVLVLLYLAFSNLFSFGNGSWTIKEKLPRVIIALIAVNFSLVAFRVVLDAVNVGSTAILSIADTAVMEQGDFDVANILNAYSKKDTGALCPLSGAEETLLSGASPDYTTVDKNMEAKNCYPFYKTMNKLMCSGDSVKGSDCFFQIKTPSQVSAAMKNGKPTTSNLMLAFGVYFQHLEQLPALASKLNDFTGVVDSVLFSAIMAMAYVVALVAVFIALLMRIIALWFFMIFSPLLVAAGIMGIGGGGGDITSKLITYLIMPLKIAGAFALSFVMIAVLIKFEPASSVQILEPGLALRQFAGGNMFGVLWKIVTVVVFWKAAFAALDGTHVDGIVKSIQSKAEGAGQFMAQAATVDVQAFNMGEGKKVSLRSLGRLPDAIGEVMRTRNAQDFAEMKSSLNLTNVSEKEQKKLIDLERLTANSVSSAKGAMDELRRRFSFDEMTSLKPEIQNKVIAAMKRTKQFDDGALDKLSKSLKNSSTPASVQESFRQFSRDNKQKGVWGEAANNTYYDTKNWGGSGDSDSKKPDETVNGKFDVMFGGDTFVIGGDPKNKIDFKSIKGSTETPKEKASKLETLINGKIGDGDLLKSVVSEKEELLRTVLGAAAKDFDVSYDSEKGKLKIAPTKAEEPTVTPTP